MVAIVSKTHYFSYYSPPPPIPLPWVPPLRSPSGENKQTNRPENFLHVEQCGREETSVLKEQRAGTPCIPSLPLLRSRDVCVHFSGACAVPRYCCWHQRVLIQHQTCTQTEKCLIATCNSNREGLEPIAPVLQQELGAPFWKQRRTT